MKVLNHDKVIKQADRNRRFLDLIKQTLTFKNAEEPDAVKPVNIAEEVFGPSLIWARGSFQFKTI